MARLTLGDQVSIVSTGEKGTIVGESNGLYERPLDSGAITAMGATYPNPLTTKTECEGQNEAPPKLTWTTDRRDQVMFQQCVFFNGEALTQADNLNIGVSAGYSNVDDTDCRGSAGAPECLFEFQFLNSYEVISYGANVWPAGHATVEVAGSRVNLGEVPLSANYEISFKMTVHAFYPGDTNGADLVTIVHLSGRRRGL